MGRVLSAIVRWKVLPGLPRGWKYTPEVVAVVIALSALPMAAAWVPPNPYYGFRTPATMATPEDWYFANRLLGWYMIFSQTAAVVTINSVAAAMTSRFGGDRVTWGTLWSCTAALVGIAAGVAHYYSRG